MKRVFPGRATAQPSPEARQRVALTGTGFRSQDGRGDRKGGEHLKNLLWQGKPDLRGLVIIKHSNVPLSQLVAAMHSEGERTTLSGITCSGPYALRPAAQSGSEPGSHPLCVPGGRAGQGSREHTVPGLRPALVARERGWAGGKCEHQQSWVWKNEQR